MALFRTRDSFTMRTPMLNDLFEKELPLDIRKKLTSMHDAAKCRDALQAAAVGFNTFGARLAHAHSVARASEAHEKETVDTLMESLLDSVTDDPGDPTAETLLVSAVGTDPEL